MDSFIEGLVLQAIRDAVSSGQPEEIAGKVVAIVVSYLKRVGGEGVAALMEHAAASSNGVASSDITASPSSN